MVLRYSSLIILNYFLYFSRLLLIFGASRNRPALRDDLPLAFFLGLGETLAFELVPAAPIPVKPPLLDSAVAVDY